MEIFCGKENLSKKKVENKSIIGRNSELLYMIHKNEDAGVFILS